MRKLAHETLGFQKNALIAEVFHDFALGERVMTCDGVLGKVTAVLDGPYPQTEVYEVTLDRGIGGGQYTATQLSKTAQAVTAASLDDTQGDEDARGDDGTDDLNPYEGSVLHTADMDYPEMGTILTDRLPNENIKVYAGLSRTAAQNHGHKRGVPITDPEYSMESGIIQCDNCGKYHSATYDHDGQFGEGRIHALVCPEDHLTDYYGDDRLEKRHGALQEPLDDAQQIGVDVNNSEATHDDKAEKSDAIAGPAIDPIDPPDACSFCGSPEFDEFTNTGRGTRARCAQCQGTMTSWGGQWQPDMPNSPANAASREGDSRSIMNDPGAIHMGSLADFDPDFGFMMRATWADVRKKAKAIKDSGGVRILAANHSGVVGEVQGEHHLYESSFNYIPGSKKVADWGCGCKWAAYSWGRSPGYKRFEGRQCSHVTALQYEAQSRGMFGRQVTHDEQRLPGQYQRSPVTVQYDRAGDKNLNRRSVPPGNMKRTFSVKANLWTMPDHDVPEISARHHLDDAFSGRVHGLDTDGNYVGSVSYSLHPHDGEAGGLVRHDIETEPGYEHHAPGLFHALENHLQSSGLPAGEWSHDDEGHDTAKSLKIEPHYASLDLAPVHAFTAAMVRAGDDVEAVLTMLGSYQVPAPVALAIVRWAAQEATAPEDGGAAQPGTDIPGIETRNQTERKEKDPKHRRHHTNDARSHAPEFGYGIAHGFGPLMWCDQCNGSGCGHCAGTGQVIAPEGASPTGGPAAGDASSTSSPVADQNSDAGSMIGSDGMSATGGLQMHEQLLRRYADYSADSFLTGPPAQNYQAPTPHSDTSNPGSTGWATSADPPNWEAPLIGNDFASFSNAASLRTGLKEGEPSIEPPTVSGVALKAADTGRVLMIQRSIKDEKDPARGTFEFPGGHHEPGDLTSLHAGIREWQEEVGQPFPEGGHVSHTWRSGPYQGHVVVVPSEDDVKFHEGRSTVNPDDPGGDDHEQSLWIHPDDARKMPNLRAELKKANPFDGIKKAAYCPQLELPFEREKPRDDVCRNCGEHVRETHDPNVPWVHSHSGNSFCDVQGTEDAAFNMGSPLHRDEAGPTFHESSVTSVTNPRGNGEGATYKPAYNPFAAALHDAPEPALPSTDGEVAPSLALGDVQDIPPGMMLSNHPVQPWGYSAGDPNGAAQGLIPGSADHDMVGTDSSGGTDAFRSEASIETAQTPEEIVAAFLATSAAKALKGDGGSGEGELTARQAAMAAAGGGASMHSSGPTDSDIAAAARQAFEKTAMKDFDFAEQQELISEGAGGPRARNFDDLQIAGTHYAQLSNDRGDEELLLA